MKSKTQHTQAYNYGKIISIRGSVIDVFFEKDLPSVHALLKVGENPTISIEVLAQLDHQRVRGIALQATQGLAVRFNNY